MLPLQRLAAKEREERASMEELHSVARPPLLYSAKGFLMSPCPSLLLWLMVSVMKLKPVAGNNYSSAVSNAASAAPPGTLTLKLLTCL